ncbi:MAG: hypothetical protein E6J71_19455 [Deltaproteobacteria bacterium]|nr:MAG: hypothetical protein E6J71_19455 [Deltaproteobacteria bacterium]
MKPDRETLEDQVKADFDAMEQALAAASPGVLDVLRLYGDCEAAVKQAEDYLSVLRPRPAIVTSDRSTF